MDAANETEGLIFCDGVGGDVPADENRGRHRSFQLDRFLADFSVGFDAGFERCESVRAEIDVAPEITREIIIKKTAPG